MKRKMIVSSVVAIALSLGIALGAASTPVAPAADVVAWFGTDWGV